MISSRRSSFSLEKIKSIGQFDIILWWILITVVQSTRCSEYKIPSESIGERCEGKKLQKVGTWTLYEQKQLLLESMLRLPRKLALFGICPAISLVIRKIIYKNFEILKLGHRSHEIVKSWNEEFRISDFEFHELLNTPCLF